MAAAGARGIQSLVLDAAPLLTQARIAGLADKYFIPPSVLAELRDVRAREYLETLHATGQVDLHVREPSAAALAQVVAFAKQTGDYAVLSPADLHVLALTYALEIEAHGTWRIRETVGGKTGQQQHEERRLAEKSAQEKAAAPAAPEQAKAAPSGAASDDPADDGFTVVERKARTLHEAIDDDEGEWITPENITQHKNKSLGLVGDETIAEEAPKKGRRRRGRKGAPARMSVACMTGDFAVQNVLLQMGLYLVGVDGLRIERVKSWVLRCHACYKICADVERKFCPSCGNATLLRTSVTAGAPGEGASGLQVHLKPNFQYKNRGTKYSLPLPRAGSASGGQASGRARNRQTGVPILREDQLEWQRAMAQQKTHRQKEERALQKSLAKGQDSLTARYADPDWMPDLLRGTHTPAASDLPALGIGRKNPNERRRRKR
ncbi:20S-pre-rRNA D-site endonuclease nob1 [Malassezia equina]|uniref:20S-pre-rRNA D-site endonuclease NOB1 n=1 Tax=Malassezia equina TaxID=1381935 RepID=A0AAF0J2U3_9BASI|nr:20S-pre-rRNA D-site endonuclease nob1 [Malassezia equina]